MALRTDITSYLDTLLDLGSFASIDMSLNGVQLEGSEKVESIAASVDCGASVVKAACDMGADLLLVHHGLFWGSPRAITGAYRDLLAEAIRSGLTIYTAHLPLDAHMTYGNNAILARELNLGKVVPSAELKGKPIGVAGDNAAKLSLDEIATQLSALKGAEAEKQVVLPFGPEVPERISIVTGSGADQLQNAKREGFDTLITGEPKQFAYHFCKEEGLNAIFAGHYATETVGVSELSVHLGEKFGVKVEFIDEPTGI